MTDPNENYTEEEIFEVLTHLVDQGKLISSCGKCKMPMSIEDLATLKCSACGEISKNDVRFISIDNVVMN